MATDTDNCTGVWQVAGMLTMDGRCKTLDAAADGYVRADAVIVLKLDAVPDGSAAASGVVLRGTFVNQDGRSSSLTAPNGPSQQAVIRGALRAAGAAASDVGTLEMHGTGTPLGAHTSTGACINRFKTHLSCSCHFLLTCQKHPVEGSACTACAAVKVSLDIRPASHSFLL